MRFITYHIALLFFVSHNFVVSTFGKELEEELQKSNSVKDTDKGLLYLLNDREMGVAPTQPEPILDNESTGIISMFSVLFANRNDLWDSFQSFREEKRGRYDIMSISGKDYVDFSYSYGVQKYDNGRGFIAPAFESSVDSIENFSNPQSSLRHGFSLDIVNNLSPSFDWGVFLGIGYEYPKDDAKIDFIKDGINGTLIAKESWYSIGFGLGLDYNKLIFDKKQIKFLLSLGAGIGFKYTRLQINETIYNPAGKFSSTDIDHNDFSLLLGFDTGFQFWINSVCLNPSVYINKNADIGYAFELHKVIGFYDSISFRYSFGNNDYGDWQNFSLGVLITML